MVLELLQDLIARPSITPDDAGCQDLIATRLSTKGFTVEFHDREGVTNLWATHGAGQPVFCFAGHTDVVPPGPAQDWMSPPFEPTVRDGHLYGRGAADMKSGVAAMVVAAERLAAEGHPGTIAVLLTSDEEGPGIHGTKFVLDQLAARGTTITAAIVGEPTSEQRFGDVVKIGRRGSMNGSLVVKGVQGHTAYPQLADNAAHKLAPLLQALLSIDWGQADEHFPATTLQVSHLESGTGASNVIPGQAEVRFNLRFGTNWTPDAIKTRVAAALGCDDVAWSVGALPFVTERGPLVEALRNSIKAECGVEPKNSTGGGTSDARFFADHGIPVAEFGVLNATIHAANECVEIESLEPLARIYAKCATQVLSGSGSGASRP